MLIVMSRSHKSRVHATQATRTTASQKHPKIYLHKKSPSMSSNRTMKFPRPYTLLLLLITSILSIDRLEASNDSPILSSSAKHRRSPDVEKISIVDRELLINGRPFVMQGICYSPVRKGGTFPEDLIFNKPSKIDLAVIERDFKMMHEAGINTIRSYVPMTDTRILDLLTKYELRTIVPVGSTSQVSPSMIQSTLLLLKNHPSTLIWEVGNEWDLNYFYSKILDQNNPEGIGFTGSLKLLEEYTKYIKSLDTMHPVSTGISAQILKNQLFWKSIAQISSIDLFGMNVYDGLSFGDRFTQWSSQSGKPLYIGECGADAFNAIDNGEDDISQEIATRSLITEIKHNLSALNENHVLVGGCLFEWNDEWWKDSHGSIATHDNGGIGSAEGGPYSDYVFNEEWWGIVDIDRHPRPAYATLKELYSKD